MSLGFSDGIELGLRLGNREGWRFGLPLDFSNGFVLGLRLGTRKGWRFGLPLDFSDGIELGLRLGTREGWRHGYLIRKVKVIKKDYGTGIIILIIIIVLPSILTQYADVRTLAQRSSRNAFLRADAVSGDV